MALAWYTPRLWASVVKPQIAVALSHSERSRLSRAYSAIVGGVGLGPKALVGVGRAFSRICLSVHALKGKRLELSTPNLVQIYTIAVARHALTQRSKVTWLQTTRLLVTIAGAADSCATCCRGRRGSACRYDCL